MATDSVNANEDVAAGQRRVRSPDSARQRRVGKSWIASWLAEFLISRGRQVRCIDGDPVNRSLSQYKGSWC